MMKKQEFPEFFPNSADKSSESKQAVACIPLARLEMSHITHPSEDSFFSFFCLAPFLSGNNKSNNKRTTKQKDKENTKRHQHKSHQPHSFLKCKAMTIHIVAITKFQTKGLRIKASYSDETVVLRQHWENVISGLSLTERGDRVEETLPCGQAHLFAKKDESKVYIVITSIEYPLWLVRSCIDELSWTDGSTTSTMISRVMAAFSALCMSREAKYRKRLQHCIDIFAKYSNDEPGCMLYDIRINCDDVDLVNDVKRYLQFRKEEEQHKKLKEVHDKVDEIKNQMMVLPVYIRHTVAQSKHLQVKSKVLLKQVMVFRKSDAELRRKTESNYHHRLGLAKVATMVVFASVGSAIALATGCKGMDVVTVAIMGGALGYVSAQWLCWLARSIVRSLTTQVQ